MTHLAQQLDALARCLQVVVLAGGGLGLLAAAWWAVSRARFLTESVARGPRRGT